MNVVLCFASLHLFIFAAQSTERTRVRRNLSLIEILKFGTKNYLQCLEHIPAEN
jgi:hypothetical protein